jgi:release factor glutamine methyltransferase
MIVTRHVLVPRPETELLAERAWKFLSQIPAEHEPRALDLGTGSGCIAIALAAHASAARIDAVDLSGDALSTARQNVSKHLLTERIRLHQGDGFSALDPRSRYDLVVSNPPYIPTAEIQTLEPEVRDFDPSMALDGGADGMDFYRRIASGAAAFLRPGGMVMLELNDHGADNVAKIFQRARWKVESVEKDYNEFTRIFIARPAAQSHDVPA